MHRANSSESHLKKHVSKAIGNLEREKAENEGKQEYTSKHQVALYDEKTSVPNQLQKHWKIHFHFAIKHSGKGRDPNARISTGLQWQEHFRNHHQEKTKLRVILLIRRNSFIAWKIWEISPNTPMFSLALDPGQVTHRGTLRLPCLLKGSEVQNFIENFIENDLQQSHSPVPAWPHSRQEPHLLGDSRQPGINKFVTAWMAWRKFGQMF